MKWLTDSFKAMFDWLFGWLQTMWNSTVAWITAVWGFIVGAASWLVDSISTWVSNIASSLSDTTNALSNIDGAHLGQFGDVMSIANAWFPLSEAVALSVTYFFVLKSLVLYRFVKSWIPTVS